MRANSDERRRDLERRARVDGSQIDKFKAAVQAERTDGMASRLERWVDYSFWIVGEVMNPRSPASWASPQVSRDKLARLISRPNLANAAVFESFDQIRPCYDDHDEPCDYDGCPTCQDNCRRPDLDRYDSKVAGLFAWSFQGATLLGIKAAPIVRQFRREDDTKEFAMRHLFGVYRASNEALGLQLNRTQTLDSFEGLDTDDIRVYDNGGRSIDRFTVLIQGEIDEDPFTLTFAGSWNQGPQGVWMTTESGFDPDNPGHVGLELHPWQELVPLTIFNQIWSERTPWIVQVPTELAKRWSVLTLGGYFK